MADGISFFSSDDINKHIRIVMTQTNYTEEESISKLKLHNCDYLKVIKEYMGIPEKNSKQNVKSVNQEVFRQIRLKLDSSMREYREKNPIDMEQVVKNLQESDEREKQKTIKN